MEFNWKTLCDSGKVMMLVIFAEQKSKKKINERCVLQHIQIMNTVLNIFLDRMLLCYMPLPPGYEVE